MIITQYYLSCLWFLLFDFDCSGSQDRSVTVYIIQNIYAYVRFYSEESLD